MDGHEHVGRGRTRMEVVRRIERIYVERDEFSERGSDGRQRELGDKGTRVLERRVPLTCVCQANLV